jgi:hypothetical protein
VSAFLDDGFALARGGLRSVAVERTPGYARAVRGVGDRTWRPPHRDQRVWGERACIDSLDFVVSAIMTIAVTSVELQRELPADHPARHPTRRDMCDLDIVIDSGADGRRRHRHRRRA